MRDSKVCGKGFIISQINAIRGSTRKLVSTAGKLRPGRVGGVGAAPEEDWGGYWNHCVMEIKDYPNM